MFYTYLLQSVKDKRWYTGFIYNVRPDLSGLSLTG